jgi:hypothetical protein
MRHVWLFASEITPPLKSRAVLQMAAQERSRGTVTQHHDNAGSRARFLGTLGRRHESTKGYPRPHNIIIIIARVYLEVFQPVRLWQQSLY